MNMQRRRLLAGFGVGLGGLAGCSAPTGDGQSGITDVEWLDGDDLEAEVLADRHAEALVDAGSFELFSTADTEHAGDERPSPWLPSQEYEARFDADLGRQYLRQESTETSERDVFELYIDGEEGFIREQVGGDVSTDRRTVERSDQQFREAMREESLAGVGGVGGWNMTVDDRTAESGGEPAVRLVADAFEGATDVPEEVVSAEATMHVRAAGVVASLEQRWDGVHRGQDAVVDIDLAFRGIGETAVEEPDWVDELRE
ncbi:hypothetical protein JCM18237_26810 [Halorubrum luteum]